MPSQTLIFKLNSKYKGRQRPLHDKPDSKGQTHSRVEGFRSLTTFGPDSFIHSPGHSRVLVGYKALPSGNQRARNKTLRVWGSCCMGGDFSPHCKCWRLYEQCQAVPSS